MPKMSLPVLASIPYTLDEVHERAGKNGLRVLSTFSGGGGSSMGYKLAGFDCIGGVEIDPKMAECYRRNLKPEFLFEMPVGEFADNEDAVTSVGEVDILDGSPPCSVFSSMGNREKDWGRERRFCEGQKVQILDSLFLDYLRLVGRVRPKVAIAENVMGMVQGNAKGYALDVLRLFREIGYEPQLFKLDASRMGVPQRRRRIFFIARRKDICLPALRLTFDEPEVSAREACRGLTGEGKPAGKRARDLWGRTKPGELFTKASAGRGFFSHRKTNGAQPFGSQSATGDLYHWQGPRHLSAAESARAQSFPDGYDFCRQQAHYVCGMSVPPLMMQRLALEIARQWFPKQAHATTSKEATRG